MTRRFVLVAACAVTLCTGSRGPGLQAQGAIRYTLSFPEPQHRWMQVEATFPDVTVPTLELRMSRSSPGRYSIHDFAKNVYDVQAFGANGREIPTSRPDPYGWNVTGHGGLVRVRYKIYGDYVDGTYLGIDDSHAHINMPAAIMWAHGLEDRPAALTFEQPAGMHWQVATQLFGDRSPSHPAVPDRFEFTAPNLQYLMDSPAEFGPVTIREFTVDNHRFRFALHHLGSDAELEAFAKDVEKVVRQERAVYGEFPEYEPGYYTFLADYLPWAHGDGMEHRNSTVMTSSRSIASSRTQLLDTVAHEFFHCWNVERIRPQGLEPFDFDRANMSDSLWLAEGFTQYYGPLLLQRAGLVDLNDTARMLAGLVETVTNDSGRLVRSAVEMSRMAPFIDGGRPVDRTNWADTVISYYPFGGAIALALDLSLRERTDGRVTLDDFMRGMWRQYGKPGGHREGYVDRPYSVADAEEMLANVSGDRAFAHEFFGKYVEGRDVASYATLLERAGFALRKRNPGQAWMGDARVESRGGAVRVVDLVAPTWPLYAAGVDQDAEIREIDGKAVRAEGDVAAIVARHRPGDRVAITFADRDGRARSATVTFGEDPHLDVVPVEAAGGTLTSAHRSIRDAWLGPKS